MPGFGSFHEKAKHEKKDGDALQDHVTNLYDEGGDIDEATGRKRNNSPKVSGADEKQTTREIKAKGESEDVMGRIHSGPMKSIPEDPEKLAEWVAQEADRLQKKTGRKKAA